MKILLLITGLGVGGAERQVVDLADAFVAAGHDVFVVYLGGVAALRPADPRVQLMSLGMTRTPLGVWRAAMALRRLLVSFQPDVVHSHLVHANLFARILRRWMPIPVLITSAHNTDEEGWWRMLGYRLTDRQSDLSTNVSREAVQAFERWGAVSPGRMRAVYNGISTEKFCFDAEGRQRVRSELGLPDKGVLLLAVGRLSLPKDYPNLLQAVALLQQRHVEQTLVIAGDGPLLPALKHLAVELGLNNQQVIFVGIRSDVAALMSAADVFVLPSAWEGFGLVVAEAMACERLVVATDCGGVSEVLGDCGWLVVPHAPIALADALATAIQQEPVDAARRGKQARCRVETHYSIDAAVQKWLAIYAQLSGQATAHAGEDA